MAGAQTANGTWRVRVGPDGRLVLPAALRRRLGLTADQSSLVQLELCDQDRAVKLSTIEDRRRELVRRISALKRSPRRSVVDELIAERRQEARDEDDA